MGSRICLSILVVAFLALPFGAVDGLDATVDTPFPEYILDDHLNLTGTTTPTSGTFKDDTNARFGQGVATNVSVTDDKVLLKPYLAFRLMNGGNAILSPGTGSVWDTVLMGFDVIVHNGTYWMYYTGSRSTSLTDPRHIGLATSTDGLNYTKYSGNPIVRSRVDSYDYTNLMSPTVIYDNGSFHMYYAGNKGNTGTNPQQDISICYANSSDGYNWTKYTSNPVIAHGSPSTAWNGFAVRPGVVFKESSTYKMYYKGVGSTGGAGPLPRMGMATSTDLRTWTENPNNPLYTPGTGWEKGKTNYQSIQSADGTYRMWTFTASTPEKTGWLWSDDGENWTDSGAAVLSPAANTIYAGGVSVYKVREVGDNLLLYATCRDSNRKATFGVFNVTPKGLDGEFISRVFDAGGLVNITGVDWSTTVDLTGYIDYFMRWGNSSGVWEPWTRIAHRDKPIGVTAMYFQYRVEFEVLRDWMRLSLDSFEIDHETIVTEVAFSVDYGPWQSVNGAPGG